MFDWKYYVISLLLANTKNIGKNANNPLNKGFFDILITGK